MVRSSAKPQNGYFIGDTSTFSHPFFAGEAFCEKIGAWWWLVAQAVEKDTRVRVGAITIDLKRGQYAFSIRGLAQKWKWSTGRVVRFLDGLAKDGFLERSGDQRSSLITICNFDKFCPQDVVS